MTIRVIVREDQSTPPVVKPTHKFPRVYPGKWKTVEPEVPAYSLHYHFCHTHNFLDILAIKCGEQLCDKCSIFLVEGLPEASYFYPTIEKYIRKFKMHQLEDAKRVLSRYLKLKAFS